MIISVTFSKPNKNIEEILEKPFLRVKIRAANNSNGSEYFAEFFTDKQAFHKKMTNTELEEFIKTHAGKTFKSCIIFTESEQKTILANKHGEIKEFTKKIAPQFTIPPTSNNPSSISKLSLSAKSLQNHNRTKN